MSITPGTDDAYVEPSFQSDSVRTPNVYRARMSGSVTASQSRSGVVLMKIS